MSEFPSHNQNPQLITSAHVPKPGQTYHVPEPTAEMTGVWEFGAFDLELAANAEAGFQAVGATSEQQNRAHEILQTGKDGGVEVSYDGYVARNPTDETFVRLKMAELSVYSPNTYEALRDQHVIGFHGTRSVALAGMMRTGKLVSARIANQLPDVHMGTGEHYAQSVSGQDSISFSHMGALDTVGTYAGERTDVTHTPESLAMSLRQTIAEAKAYDGPSDNIAEHIQAAGRRAEEALDILTNKPKGLEATLMLNDFPVMVGISADFLESSEANPSPAVKHGRIKTGETSMGEFRPMVPEIPIDEGLPVFAVPAARVEGTQKLLRQFGHNTTVVPIEDLRISYPSDMYTQ